jgi:hypothetical protein
MSADVDGEEHDPARGGPMLRLGLFIIIGAALIGAVTLGIRRSRRRGDATPELHRHPERLDQMLDSSDDA